MDEDAAAGAWPKWIADEEALEEVLSRPNAALRNPCDEVFFDAAATETRVGLLRKATAALHVCDWLVPTTDLAFDRGMPGDGVIDISRIRAMAETVGYRASPKSSRSPAAGGRRTPRRCCAPCSSAT